MSEKIPTILMRKDDQQLKVNECERIHWESLGWQAVQVRTTTKLLDKLLGSEPNA
jgi:hypothetical protein